MRLGLSLLAVFGLHPDAQAVAPMKGHRQAVAAHRPRLAGFLERRRWRMSRSPDGQRVALIAPRGAGEALHVDGRPVYPRAGGARLVSAPVWSPDGRGIAVLERKPGGTLQLVALPTLRERPVVMDLPELGAGVRPIWLAADRIAVGKSELAPQLIVSWTETPL